MTPPADLLAREVLIRVVRTRKFLPWSVALLLVATTGAVCAREAGEPVRLAWEEGDLAGVASILSPDGRETLGLVEYHQTRRGDMLRAERVARYRNGSSDEDHAEARVGETLEAVRGRTVIRDERGRAVVDLTIDVAGGHIRGTAGEHTVDDAVTLPAGTYWGPLVFLVLKNFDRNAVEGRLTFRTIAPTPRPRVFDLELVRGDATVVQRAGAELQSVRFSLTPTFHWTIDPVVRVAVPRSEFLVLPGTPPALARYTGPRNYEGERIRVE